MAASSSSFVIDDIHIKGVQASIDFAESTFMKGPVKLEEMAWFACMSPFHFNRIFHRILGFSPGAYVRERRLSEAAYLLIDNKTTAANISQEIGYGSLEAFSRAFHKNFHLWPAEFRKFGFLPYLMTPKIPSHALHCNGIASNIQIKFTNISERHYIGLYRMDTNNHAENMRTDYELLRFSSGICIPDQWLFFDRYSTSSTKYEMFIGWEYDDCIPIPKGLQALVIPGHNAAMISYRGRLDTSSEVELRCQIQAQIIKDYNLRVSTDAWKLTHSVPDQNLSGWRIWTFEIPLQ